jgi:hypothetical protein
MNNLSITILDVDCSDIGMYIKMNASEVKIGNYPNLCISSTGSRW